jgi:hypothetical protein
VITKGADEARRTRELLAGRRAGSGFCGDGHLLEIEGLIDAVASVSGIATGG